MKGIAKAIVSHAVLLMALAATASAQPPVLIGFEEGEARLAARGAVERAAARLADPRCQKPSCTFATQSTEAVAGQASEMAPHARVRGVTDDQRDDLALQENLRCVWSLHRNQCGRAGGQ